MAPTECVRAATCLLWALLSVILINPTRLPADEGPCVCCRSITLAGSLPAGTVGANYTGTITASGSTATPYTFTVTSNSLSPGLSLNATNGVISGTPVAAGTNTFAVQAADAYGCAAPG